MWTSEPRLTRHWQFSLRTVFAIVTLVATMLGWHVWAGDFLQGRVRPTLLEIVIYSCPFAVLFVGPDNRSRGLDWGIVQFSIVLWGAATTYYLTAVFMSFSHPTPTRFWNNCADVVVWTFVVPVSLLIEALALNRGISLTGLRWFHWFTPLVVTVNIGLLTYLSFWFSRLLPVSWW